MSKLDGPPTPTQASLFDLLLKAECNVAPFDALCEKRFGSLASQGDLDGALTWLRWLWKNGPELPVRRALDEGDLYEALIDLEEAVSKVRAVAQRIANVSELLQFGADEIERYKEFALYETKSDGGAP